MRNDCILWKGCCGSDGYGSVTIGGIQYRAHRIAWEKANKQKIPEGMWVLHHCDNPRCVNPAHLFLGTAKDNIQDCINKGRRNTPYGSIHHAAKINEKQAPEIKMMRGIKLQKEVANKFGISVSNVSRIMRGKGLKHAEDQL